MPRIPVLGRWKLEDQKVAFSRISTYEVMDHILFKAPFLSPSVIILESVHAAHGQQLTLPYLYVFLFICRKIKLGIVQISFPILFWGCDCSFTQGQKLHSHQFI